MTMLTEIEVLQAICWISLTLSIIAFFFTTIPALKANGTAPILFVLSAVSIMCFIGAYFLLLITYNIDQINSTGQAEVGVFYLRMKPGMVSALLIWLSWKVTIDGHS